MNLISNIKSTFSRKPEIQNTISTSRELYQFLVESYGYETVAGVNITPEKAMTVSALHAAVRVISESIACLPLGVVENTPMGQVWNSEHPLHPLFTYSPNGWQNIFEYLEMKTMHICLHGNAYSFINRSGNRILELLPIHPNRVSVKQLDNYNLEYEIALPNGEKLILGQADIFHIRDTSLNGVTGNPRIKWLRDELGLAIKTQNHGSMVFGNGARPAGVLSTPEKLKQENINQIAESWKAAHGGGRMMGTAVLDAAFKFTPITYNSKDSQYIETRTHQIAEVARVWRVPPHMIGDLARSTNNNIEQQSLEFVKFTLQPWLKRWEMAINCQLISPQRQGKFEAKFNEKALLRGDLASRSEFYSKMIASKIMTRNEARREEGLPEVEGGDEFENPNITPGDKKNEKTVDQDS
jgi:HK97 family phage portal protein